MELRDGNYELFKGLNLCKKNKECEVVCSIEGVSE